MSMHDRTAIRLYKIYHRNPLVHGASACRSRPDEATSIVVVERAVLARVGMLAADRRRRWHNRGRRHMPRPARGRAEDRTTPGRRDPSRAALHTDIRPSAGPSRHGSHASGVTLCASPCVRHHVCVTMCASPCVRHHVCVTAVTPRPAHLLLHAQRGGSHTSALTPRLSPRRGAGRAAHRQLVLDRAVGALADLDDAAARQVDRRAARGGARVRM